MRQVFRLMDMPDRLIAFDELPEDLIKEVELHDEKKMARHWRDYFGIQERKIKIKPYYDTMLNKLVQADPLIERGPYTYLIDRSLNKDKELWQHICNYVRRNCPAEFRLLDSIDEMAKPFAPDPHSEITLEPEEVITIPLNKPVTPQEDEFAPRVSKEPQPLMCEDCGKEFDSKRAMRMHKMKLHPKVAA